MILTRKTLPFIGIMVLACIVLLFSLWDIIYHESWLERIIALYGILFILTLLFLATNTKKKPAGIKNVEEFETSLKGRLHHFKCPVCGGIFAIKKSRHNNKKSFTLTCPDCGTTGTIPSKPSKVIEEIPEKKSINKNFKCEACGGSIMVWAEGADIVSDVKVYSCPYCGTKQRMRQN
jgi:predicted RNA-binding Zn-ribbon protein involved in translation (DUF1610 family)